MKRALAIVVSLALALAACRSAQHAPPDLGKIYNRAARYHDARRNPIIVIPGTLGTKLVDSSTGQVVWGAFGGKAASPQEPAGARSIALPLRPGVPLAELVDDVVPDGVLEEVKVRLAGLPFQLAAYFQILLTLGAGGYRDETFGPGDVDWGSEHFTCFQFDYDWRRDNVENVRRLHEFLLEKRAYVAAETRRRYGVETDVRFDLVAHSMGGLLARYYLRYGVAELPEDGLPELTWAGARYVDRAILIGPPNAGSPSTVDFLLEGRKFGPMTPRYDAAVLGTFPSIYQLLPRSRHRRVVEAGDPDKEVDVLDPEVWAERGWGLAAPAQDRVLAWLLPDVTDAGERRAIALDHQAKSLRRARQLHAALDVEASPPEGTRIYLIAGDALATPSVVAVDGDGKVEVVGQAPGDGTVLRSSALMDERLGREWTPRLRSPVDWTHVTFLFSDHLGMTRDPFFSDNLLYLLLETPRDGPAP